MSRGVGVGWGVPAPLFRLPLDSHSVRLTFIAPRMPRALQHSPHRLDWGHALCMPHPHGSGPVCGVRAARFTNSLIRAQCEPGLTPRKATQVRILFRHQFHPQGFISEESSYVRRTELC